MAIKKIAPVKNRSLTRKCAYQRGSCQQTTHECYCPAATEKPNGRTGYVAGFATNFHPRPRARPVTILDGAHPQLFEMWMLGRPGQHGAGDGKIIVLAGRTFITHAILFLFDFERSELFESALTHLSVGQADPIRAKFSATSRNK